MNNIAEESERLSFQFMKNYNNILNSLLEENISDSSRKNILVN